MSFVYSNSKYVGPPPSASLGQFVQARSDHEARERYGVETSVQPNHWINMRRQIGHREVVFVQDFVAVHQTRDVQILATS